MGGGSAHGSLTPIEEKSLISLAFDEPEFFSFIVDRIKDEYITSDECRLILALIKHYHKHNAEIPTREFVRNSVLKHIDVDSANYEELLELFSFKINPRDYKIIKQNIIKWLQSKAYGAIFSEEAIEAYRSGEYNKIHEIIENASRIQDIGDNGMWFFDNIEMLFKQDVEIKYTTGFTALDAIVNEGGPTKGDVLVWMAPTGVGKSIAIVNNAAACIYRKLNVLHITLELSWWKTALRYCGVFSKIPIGSRHSQHEYITRVLRKLKETCGASLAIFEYPPDDISVDTILALVDHLYKTRKWRPDVIAIDYLELLLSRNQYFNRDEYLRQKKISTEVRQLAKKADAFVITATQTNRGDIKGTDRPSQESFIELNRVAESYGKMMPVDYVISINQSAGERTKNLARLYVAKNRNGPKFVSLTTRFDYETMCISAIDNNEYQSILQEGE